MVAMLGPCCGEKMNKPGSIARIWRVIILTENSRQYLGYLGEVVIPAYRAAEGMEEVIIMQEPRGELTHFLLLSIWSSNEALVKFTGVDREVVCPSIEERRMLAAFESTASCYAVIAIKPC